MPRPTGSPPEPGFGLCKRDGLFRTAECFSFEEGWQEHVQGKTTIPPLAPAKFHRRPILATRGDVLPECTDFIHSLESATGSFVERSNLTVSEKPRDARLHVLGGGMSWIEIGLHDAPQHM